MRKDIILQELSSGRNYTVSLPCILGRGSEVDLTLPDPSISHRHALIEQIDDQIWIEDLRSSNGVYVNGRRIGQKTLLKPCDSIQLGQTKFLFSEADDDLTNQTVVLGSLHPEAKRSLDRERLEMIYEIATELSETQDLTVLGEKILLSFKEIFHQDRSYLALFQKDGDLKPVCSDSSSSSIPLSRSIVNRVLKNGESLLLEDALSDLSLNVQDSVVALRIRSALCVPLIYHNQIHGLIFLDRSISGAYTREDLEFLRAIAAILSPLIENARLWSELKSHYADAMQTLRNTQARLIDMERKAAYVRLAQAMAHEIRNPLMAIGGLVRRLGRSGTEHPEGDRFVAVIDLVERVETILKEVDDFVKTQPLQKKLVKIDELMEDVIAGQSWKSSRNAPSPTLLVNTPHLMIPLDPDLFKKALTLIFREVFQSVGQKSELRITIEQAGHELDIVIGEIDRSKDLFEPFDPELHHKPWSLGLFLNIAHKIISDHGGKLLLDPQGRAPFPLLITVPRIH